MKFDLAIKRSIKAFLDGRLPDALIEAQGKDLIYTPDYLDELEASFAEEPEMEDEDGTDS
jgi:hypothetical protein